MGCCSTWSRRVKPRRGVRDHPWSAAAGPELGRGLRASVWMVCAGASPRAAPNGRAGCRRAVGPPRGANSRLAARAPPTPPTSVACARLLAGPWRIGRLVRRRIGPSQGGAIDQGDGLAVPPPIRGDVAFAMAAGLNRPALPDRRRQLGAGPARGGGGFAAGRLSRCHRCANTRVTAARHDLSASRTGDRNAHRVRAGVKTGVAGAPTSTAASANACSTMAAGKSSAKGSPVALGNRARACSQASPGRAEGSEDIEASLIRLVSGSKEGLAKALLGGEGLPSSCQGRIPAYPTPSPGERRSSEAFGVCAGGRARRRLSESW
jgi:hypothetical protein